MPRLFVDLGTQISVPWCNYNELGLRHAWDLPGMPQFQACLIEPCLDGSIRPSQIRR